MATPLLDAAHQLRDQLVAWRRHLHAHPELSQHEAQTAWFIADELRRLGYQPRERVGGTFGVVADLATDRARVLALRADMDALPVTEDTGLEFASTNPGVMHACGHDAHVAMLLGAAQLLMQRRAELPRSVRLIFQPAEECYPGGAAALIDAGVLDHVQRLFGLHIWSEMPGGTLGTRAGSFMSSVNDLYVTITGRGGHAAMPQQCVDPIVVAADTVLALQTVVSRGLAMTDHAVVSITQMHGGTACNILPETVELRGTIRTLAEPVRAAVIHRVRELIDGIARAHGATAAIDVRPGYPVLANDPTAVEEAMGAARTLGFNAERLLLLPPQGGGEDFAYYAQKVPSALLFLGARSEAKACAYPHHHPRFNIDEDILPLGAALLAQFAIHASA